MLSVLKSQIGENIVYNFDYQNLAPLYVDETMHVCVQKKDGGAERQTKYDVWIEGSGGGFAVRGSAIVGPVGTEGESTYEG